MRQLRAFSVQFILLLLGDLASPGSSFARTPTDVVLPLGWVLGEVRPPNRWLAFQGGASEAAPASRPSIVIQVHPSADQKVEVLRKKLSTPTSAATLQDSPGQVKGVSRQSGCYRLALADHGGHHQSQIWCFGSVSSAVVILKHLEKIPRALENQTVLMARRLAQL